MAWAEILKLVDAQMHFVSTEYSLKNFISKVNKWHLHAVWLEINRELIWICTERCKGRISTMNSFIETAEFLSDGANVTFYVCVVSSQSIFIHSLVCWLRHSEHFYVALNLQANTAYESCIHKIDHYRAFFNNSKQRIER